LRVRVSPDQQKYGIVSEWSKDAVCKTVMIKFIIVGSNPTYASKWLVTVGRYVDLFLSGFETHTNFNNGAVAEWHEGDELQPHTHWFDPSPCLKCRDNEDDRKKY